MEQTLTERVQAVREKIEAAARAAGRAVDVTAEDFEDGPAPSEISLEEGTEN